jgi:diguanylate cyclase
MSDIVVDATTPVELLHSVVAESGTDLVAHFYDALLKDEEARLFLNHSVVHSRLSASMRDWLESLLGEEDILTSQALRERQKVIGEVHSRIKVPMHLVMQGAIVLKSELAKLLTVRALDAGCAANAIQLAGIRIDTAIMLMSQVYVTDATARARLDEAYRLFSIDQDVSTEREAQRASLMEWSQKTLFDLLRGQRNGRLVRLANSPFGLWIRHRATFMFENTGFFHDLLSETARIDSVLLPQLESADEGGDRIAALTELQTAVDHAAYLLGELFQTLAALENGRDPLTRALNRRFLPAILGREISFANESRTPLSILLLDIDHFKTINDRFGHQTGDLALRQVAQVIVDHVRPSDFVFRYGGEEFLVVLTETAIEEAQVIAERIRLALASYPIDTGTAQNLTLTASIGVAAHNGHPDQQYLIKIADTALYAAKTGGRNRIEVGY